MAPVGMIGTLGWFSSAEVGIISLVAFLVLSATLLVLCARCFRKPTNAYDVNGTMKVRSGGAKGTSGANGVASPNLGETPTQTTHGGTTKACLSTLYLTKNN